MEQVGDHKPLGPAVLTQDSVVNKRSHWRILPPVHLDHTALGQGRERGYVRMSFKDGLCYWPWCVWWAEPWL